MGRRRRLRAATRGRRRPPRRAARDRALRHLDSIHPHGLRHLPSALLGAIAIRISHEEAGEEAVRRVAEEPPPQQLLVGERVGVELCRGPDGVVGRRVGLNDDPAGERSPSGTAGDLRQELEGALGGPVVGQVQRRVGGDDRDERHARQVEPLGGELRAH
jgi:hypothetical protein